MIRVLENRKGSLGVPEATILYAYCPCAYIRNSTRMLRSFEALCLKKKTINILVTYFLPITTKLRRNSKSSYPPSVYESTVKDVRTVTSGKLLSLPTPMEKGREVCMYLF